MYGDYLRAIAEKDEPIAAVRDRLLWKISTAAARNSHEVMKQATLCEQLIEDLEAPEGSARHEYAARYLGEAKALEADKAEQQRRHEATRAKLETEYFEMLQKRVENEKRRNFQ